MKNNILEEIDCKNKCCGCENCLNVCPNKAISFKMNEEGFYYPVIDDSKCVKCGLCVVYCPVTDSNVSAKPEHNIIAKAGFSKDEQIVKESASGGAAFSFMIKCFNDNFHVFGVAYSSDFLSCNYEEAQNLDDLNKFRSSKYVMARKFDTFFKIKTYLENNEKVLFIGLPCEIGALKKYLNKDFNNLLTVELICHGPGSEIALKQYLSDKKDEMIAFSVRHKHKGWTPPYIYQKYKIGKAKTIMFDSTAYGYSFRNMARLSCYNCAYKGNNKCADLTIGDYWGVDSNSNSWNKNGVSLVLAHTNKGICFLDTLDNMNLFDIDYNEALKHNPMLNKSRSIGNREKYRNDFVFGGIVYARKQNETIKEKLVRTLRPVKYLFVKNIDK